MGPGRELDALVAEKVMGLQLVGDCRAWDPEGSGYVIMRPSEDGHLGSIRPAHVAHCVCDILPLYQDDEDDWPGDHKSWQRVAKEAKKSFEADVAVWGHDRGCLGVVPWYSTDISAAWQVVEWAREMFSRWNMFTDQLQRAVSVNLSGGEIVAHSFVWRLVKPEHICLAVLEVVRGTA